MDQKEFERMVEDAIAQTVERIAKSIEDLPTDTTPQQVARMLRESTADTREDWNIERQTRKK